MGAGITCIIISLFVLLIGGVFKKVPNQRKAIGIIDSIEFAEFVHDSLDDSGDNMYYYYIKYSVDGKEYLLKTNSTSRATDVIGKKRKVKYNKNNPEQAIECPSKFIYNLATVFFVFGLYAILSSI